MFSFPWGSYSPAKRYLAHSSVLSHPTNTFADYKILDKRSRVIMKGLAKTFIEITRARGTQGKALADTSAIDYWQGAVMALKYVQHDSVVEDIAKIGALEIGPRGYQAILEIDASP